MCMYICTYIKLAVLLTIAVDDVFIQVMKEENEKNKVKLNELESLVVTEAKLKAATNLDSKHKEKVIYMCTCI